MMEVYSVGFLQRRVVYINQAFISNFQEDDGNSTGLKVIHGGSNSNSFRKSTVPHLTMILSED